MELNDSDADIRKSSRIMSRIYVEGYDTSLSGHDLVAALKEHFASCGEVIHVYIPGYIASGTRNLNRFVLVYLRGEGEQEKALKLCGSEMGGSDMGGHKVVAKAYPFHAEHLDPELAPTRDADNKRNYTMGVMGYDTSLSVEYVKSMLIQHFSKCGRVPSLDLYKDESKGVLYSKALVTLVGQNAIDKALQLCGCDVEGLKNIEVSLVAPPDKNPLRIGFNPNNPNFKRRRRIKPIEAASKDIEI